MLESDKYSRENTAEKQVSEVLVGGGVEVLNRLDGQGMPCWKWWHLIQNLKECGNSKDEGIWLVEEPVCLMQSEWDRVGWDVVWEVTVPGGEGSCWLAIEWHSLLFWAKALL